MSRLEKAKKLIDEFVLEEYGHEADFNNLKDVGLLYTTLGDNDEYEIQISADLERFGIKSTLTAPDDTYVAVTTYPSIQKLIESELKGINYDDLLATAQDKFRGIGIEI